MRRLLVFLLLLPFAVFSQSYPEKPVRVVVPFPAGGPTDIFARQVAKKLSEVAKEQFYVENLPGAGGNVGTHAVAKARPDGHSVVFVSASLAIAPTLYKSLPFDPVKDLEPVGLVGIAPMILVTHAQGPDSVKALIGMAKANPDKYTYASAGNGTATHLGGEAFKVRAALDVLHVPYKGTAPAMTDVLAGRHLFIFDYIGPMKKYAETGRLRILAIASPARSPQVPEVPTFAEAGVPGFEAGTWNMFLAPAGTPKPIVERLSALLREVLKDREVAQQVAALGIEPVSDSTPQSARKLLQDEIVRWGSVVRASGAKVD